MACSSKNNEENIVIDISPDTEIKLFDLAKKQVAFSVHSNGEHHLPLLKKIDSMGRPNYWKIYCVENRIHRESWIGKCGKIKKYVPLKKGVTNEGKKNEMNGDTSALFHALSKWKKQKDKGYEEIESKTWEVEVGNEETEVKYLPMLAEQYEDKKNYLTFPCAASRKIDGVRCVSYMGKDGKVKLYSRHGKEFNFLNQIRKDLEIVFNRLDDYLDLEEQVDFPELILDGEIYNHDIQFDDFKGFATSKVKPSKNDDKLEYWLFDIISKKDYSRRVDILRIIKKLVEDEKLTTIKFEFYELMNSHDEIDRFQDKYFQEGFEGVIVRNLKGPHITGTHRSTDLLKYKLFEDKEFKIVGCTEGEGSEEGAIMFICQFDETRTLDVRPMGNIESRKEQFLQKEKYIGKMLTVKYQPMKDPTKLPRFGVGKAFREEGEY